MIDAIVRGALNGRAAVLLGALALLIGGLLAFRDLTIEAFPDPTDTQVQVITLFDGQPTEEVERRVSLPIERAVNGTPHLVRARSISLFGLSFVTLTFDDGLGAQEARQLVLERLREAALPDGVTPELGPMATPIGEVYRYTLGGGTADPMMLRTLQEWVVRPSLLQVPGVAEVVTYGGLVKEVHVEPDPRKLAQLGLGLDDVFRALERASANASGGYVERGSEMFVIRSLGMFRTLDDIRDSFVGATGGGVPVRLRDVATVDVGYAPRQGIVSRDDDEDAVEGIVLMRRGENPTNVLDALRARIEELNGGQLADGVRLIPFYDRTELVDTTLHTVFHNLLEGALLVLLVLFAFTLSVRASLIVAAVIPMSLATAFLYLRARGMSANLLSMGAVDFGIIVDGAVILVEHLFHVIPHGDPHVPVKERVARAVKEVARPTLFSMLIIIAAYLPIFAMQRVEGRIFGPMAHTVVSALVGAMIVSFTVVPVLAVMALRHAGPPPVSPLITWSERFYDRTLRAALAYPLAVALLAGGTLLSAGVLVPKLGSEFLPELNEGALYVTFSLPGNLSLTEGRRLVPQLRELLRRTPEVDALISQLGRPEDGTDPTLPNNLEFFVKLAPPDRWRPDHARLNDLVREMATNLTEVPGLEVNFSQPIRDNVAENISGQFGQVALKIYGDDLVELQKAADAAEAAIATVPGVADLGVVKAGEQPQIAIDIDRAALGRYPLDLATVQDLVETAMAGHVANELWEGERRSDVTVRLPHVTREDLEAIRRLPLPLPEGKVIPLEAVASVHIDRGRAAITRENGHRYVGLRMNVRNRDLGGFVAEARAKVDAAVRLPEGYRLTWGGEFENQERAMKRLAVVVPLAIGLTFALLYAAFQRLSDALLVLVHVPLALVGGVFGLALAGMTLSVSAVVGFIALLGQAVLNGVLVVASVRARLERGEGIDAAVQGGAEDRLRSILMTALLASLGLVPAAMSHGIGSETQRPIAVVVVAGTLSAAALTLYVLPVSLRAWLRRAAASGPPTDDDVAEAAVPE